MTAVSLSPEYLLSSHTKAYSAQYVFLYATDRMYKFSDFYYNRSQFGIIKVFLRAPRYVSKVSHPCFQLPRKDCATFIYSLLFCSTFVTSKHNLIRISTNDWWPIFAVMPKFDNSNVGISSFNSIINVYLICLHVSILRLP